MVSQKKMHISRKITSYGYIRISNGIFKKAINYQVFLVSLLLWWGLLKLKNILSTTKFILDKILPTIRKIIFEEAGVVEQFGTLGAPQTSLVINRIVHSKMRSLSDLAVTSHANHIFFLFTKTYCFNNLSLFYSKAHFCERLVHYFRAPPLEGLLHTCAV